MMKTNYAMENVSCNNIVISKNLKDAPIIVKGQNGHLSSADIAPVHSACSKQSKVLTMESENKLINRPLTPISDNESSSSSLSLNIKEKLNINTKAVKSFGKNGIKLGTTDVEVHCGPSVGVSFDEMTKVLHGKTSVQDLNISLSNSQAQFNCISSHERKYNSAHLSSKANYSGTTFNSSAISSNICKPDLNLASNGTICNGHTISEATSSNSIAVSDFSLSSDKSTSLDSSYSFSGARPRKRNTSNSSSKSVQQYSECEVGLSFDVSLNNITSESCKIGLGLPEEKLSTLESEFALTNHIKEDSNYLNINYVNYENENQMEAIMKLIQKDLSEPYSIYTYRYFIHNWPKLCFLAVHGNEVVGAIVCKLDVHKKVTVRGYIAMLAVDQSYRKRRIGSNLVQRAIREMTADDADEVVLETEITNKPALQLYENLGFVRDKRLFRYYLNGVDALRLKLWLR